MGGPLRTEHRKAGLLLNLLRFAVLIGGDDKTRLT